MKFNLKYLILPLSIMACINNNCINAMEDNNTTEVENLNNRVARALEHVRSMNSAMFIDDEQDNIIQNFSDFLNGRNQLNMDFLQEIESIIDNYNDFQINDYEVESDSDEDIALNTNPVTNAIMDYNNDDNRITNHINTTEVEHTHNMEDNGIELTQDIIDALRFSLIYYYNNIYGSSYLLKLYENLDTPQKLTQNDKQFLLNCHQNQRFLQKFCENELILNMKNYLKLKSLSLNPKSNEYNTIVDKVQLFDRFLNTESLISTLNPEDQKYIYDLQDEMTRSEENNTIEEDVEKANPTESEEELLEMISVSLNLLRYEIRSKKYPEGSNAYYIIQAKINECVKLIDDRDIRNNITKEQYDYFKNLKSTGEVKINEDVNQPLNEKDAFIYNKIDNKIEEICKQKLAVLVKKYQRNDFEIIVKQKDYKAFLSYVRNRMFEYEDNDEFNSYTKVLKQINYLEQLKKPNISLTITSEHIGL